MVPVSFFHIENKQQVFMNYRLKLVSAGSTWVFPVDEFFRGRREVFAGKESRKLFKFLGLNIKKPTKLFRMSRRLFSLNDQRCLGGNI